MTTPFQAKFSGAGEFEPVAEPLYGLRLFRLFDESLGLRVMAGRLASPVVEGYVWRAGENVAVCPIGALQTLIDQLAGLSPEPRHRHRPPRPSCQCGFWAYSPPAGPVELQSLASARGRSVIGVVEAWGRMVVGTLGFRAEKARIVALAFPGPGETDPLVVMEPVAAAMDRARRIVGLQVSTKPWERVTAPERAALGRTYPAAAQFGSVEQMLAEFPLSDLSVFAQAQP